MSDIWITSLTLVPFIAVLGRDLSSALAFQRMTSFPEYQLNPITIRSGEKSKDVGLLLWLKASLRFCPMNAKQQSDILFLLTVNEYRWFSAF